MFKKFIAAILSLLVGFYFYASYERDADFHYFYPGGFGTGDIKKVMTDFYEKSPKKTTSSQKIIPIFSVSNVVTGEIQTSYDLLSDFEKKNIGFDNGDDYLKALLEKNKFLRHKSIVGKEKLTKDGDWFILVNITKRPGREAYIEIQHELYHFLDKFYHHFGRKLERSILESVKSAIDKDGDIEDFNKKYGFRYNEFAANFYASYFGVTSLDEKTLKLIKERARKIQNHIDRVTKFNPRSVLFYDINSVIDFYESLGESDYRENCDFNCIATMFSESKVAIDSEVNYLLKSRYFHSFKSAREEYSENQKS